MEKVVNEVSGGTPHGVKEAGSAGGAVAAVGSTPGPWTAQRQDEDDGDIYWAVHATRGYEFITNVHSNKHDAALIAAAPALRAALKELLDLCEDYGDFECRDIEPYKFDAIVDDVKRQARLALTLASLDALPKGTSQMNMVSRADYKNELSQEARNVRGNGLMALRMAKVIRDGASAIRTELMGLCKELSLDEIDECERQILAWFGPETAAINDAVVDITHRLRAE